MINDESRVKPQPLQPEELKEVEARCEAASPGPWNRECDAVYTAHECGDTCERTLHDHFVFADPDVKPADAEFIAHARTDIPRLIATIEETRREQPVRVTDAMVDAAPALPAEVEAVVFDLHDACVNLNYEGACGCCGPCKAATLLRRYAQAVAEKDAEIARLTAIEERAKSYRALLTPGSYCEISECQVFDDMTVILWEEH